MKHYLTEITAVCRLTGNTIQIDGPLIVAESFEQAEEIAPRWVEVIGEIVGEVDWDDNIIEQEVDLEAELREIPEEEYESFVGNLIIEMEQKLTKVFGEPQMLFFADVERINMYQIN